jgi:hypothetical protein
VGTGLLQRIRPILKTDSPRIFKRAVARGPITRFGPVVRQATAGFERDYGAKYPKAVALLRRDKERLLTFFDFPAEHWLHLRTANVIESPFATVRLRQRVTKGQARARRACSWPSSCS